MEWEMRETPIKYPWQGNGINDDEEQLAPFFKWLDELPEDKQKIVYMGLSREELAKTGQIEYYIFQWEPERVALKLVQEQRSHAAAVLEKRNPTPRKPEKSIIPDGVDFWEFVNEHWEVAPSCLQPYLH